MNAIIASLDLDFFRYALICGALMAPLMGLLGSFVVLRGLSFFGEAIGHSTVAGVGVAMLLGLSPIKDPTLFLLTLLALSLATAFAIERLEARGALRTDTTIAIVYAAMVAGGNLLIVKATDGNASGPMIDALFGSILWVRGTDIAIFGALVALLGVFLWKYRAPLTIMTVHAEYGLAIGIKTRLVSMLFLALLTMAVAASVRLMGAVLVTALLVIPAAAARSLAASLRQMLILSVAVAFACIEGGLMGSVALDLPAGPSIIVLATAIFAVSLAVRVARASRPSGPQLAASQ